MPKPPADDKPKDDKLSWKNSRCCTDPKCKACGGTGVTR